MTQNMTPTATTDDQLDSRISKVGIPRPKGHTANQNVSAVMQQQLWLAVTEL